MKQPWSRQCSRMPTAQSRRQSDATGYRFPKEDIVMTGYRNVPKRHLVVPMFLALAVAGTAHAAVADAPVGHGELPAPGYPAGSTHQGTVVMHLEVGIDGSVRRVELKHSSGHGDLDQAAMQAARRWRFTPALEDGKPVASWISVPVNFERHTGDAGPATPAQVPQGMLLATGN